MGKNELSHEQVWDDSALIQSWDDALEEYKLYHSIHARGEKVEDVLKKVQMQSDESQPEVREGQYDHEQSPDGFKEESEMDVEVRIQQREAVAQNAASHSTQTASLSQLSQPSGSKAVLDGEIPATYTTPASLVGGVQDPALKNLMMSWYYAGYYTGLHEGQQQAQSSPTHHQ